MVEYPGIVEHRKHETGSSKYVAICCRFRLFRVSRGIARLSSFPRKGLNFVEYRIHSLLQRKVENFTFIRTSDIDLAFEFRKKSALETVKLVF